MVGFIADMDWLGYCFIYYFTTCALVKTMTLTRISKLSGVPLRTLQRWRTTKPFVFAAVCEKANRDKYQAQADEAWPNLNIKVK